jgi:hypothetical protein
LLPREQNPQTFAVSGKPAPVGEVLKASYPRELDNWLFPDGYRVELIERG